MVHKRNKKVLLYNYQIHNIMYLDIYVLHSHSQLIYVIMIKIVPLYKK